MEEFFVENLSVHPCYSAKEVLGCYSYGVKNKVVASHNANLQSSRSHCIFTLAVDALDKESGSILTSKLQLVDLAGSEKVAQTGNEGLALKESIEINKALFTLRQVISTLAGLKEQDNTFVPYRDSKLTSLLKQSIGGNSFCLMIACIAPVDAFFEDNLSTLAYATKASCISNEPVKNVDPKSKVIKDLKKQVKRLTSELKLANEQIAILSEIPEKKSGKDLKSLRIKHFDSVPDSYKLLTPQHKADSEFSEFMYSPEILSEKLYDSVKLIRDLMNSNKKLKEMLNSLSQAKKQLEMENAQLQSEVQDLQEKLEMVENLEFNKSDEKLLHDVWNLQKEKEQLMLKVAQLERENKSQGFFVPGKSEWPWKSKRTVMRNKKQAEASRPLSLVTNHRVERTTPKVSFRPSSQDSSIDLSKQDAISALTQFLTRDKGN
jgi:kinesin family protein 4/21/27